MKKFVNRTSNKLFIHMQKHPEKFFSFVLNGIKAIRLDRFLSEELRSEGVSREKIKTAIRNGSCMVEKEICLDVDRKVLPGENISLCLQASPSQVMPEQGDLDILYEGMPGQVLMTVLLFVYLALIWLMEYITGVEI